MDVEEVVRLVHEAYDRLPAKGKPGRNEWTTLAAVVVVCAEGKVSVASLATGVHCLSTEKIAQDATSLVHDLHAEILALRAFNLHLLEQGGGDFRHAKIYLYVSEIPCGDASMEETMSLQVDPSPWTPLPTAAAGRRGRGREDFGRLGICRTKPGRGDAPPTHVASCSDKLSLRQCTGILSSPTRAILPPLYMDGLVLPRHPVGCTRAFEQRMAHLRGWSCGEYAYHPLPIVVTSTPFAQARGPDKSPCPASIVHSPGGHTEVLVGGLRMGSASVSSPRRSLSTHCAHNLHAKSNSIKILGVKRQVKQKLGWM